MQAKGNNWTYNTLNNADQQNIFHSLRCRALWFLTFFFMRATSQLQSNMIRTGQVTEFRSKLILGCVINASFTTLHSRPLRLDKRGHSHMIVPSFVRACPCVCSAAPSLRLYVSTRRSAHCNPLDQKKLIFTVWFLPSHPFFSAKKQWRAKQPLCAFIFNKTQNTHIYETKYIRNIKRFSKRQERRPRHTRIQKRNRS